MFSKFTNFNLTLKLMPKVKNCVSQLYKHTNLFCKNTSLHGLKYLTDKDLYPLERLFFGLAIITVVLAAGFFVLAVLDKWNTNPVLLGTNPIQSYVTQEPFPAVTICNLNVAYKKKTAEFSVYSNEHAMLQMLCNRDVNVTIADNIKDWNHLIPFLTEIAQPCSNMVLSCEFGAVKYNCSELFKPIITDEGLCCTFNMVHPVFVYNSMRGIRPNDSDETGGFIPVAWSAENGYPKDLPEKYYPRPTSGIGETLGLSVTLDVESSEYYCSSMSSVGFKIVVHSPTEIPSMKEIGLLLSPGRETKIRLRPEKYEAEQKLRKVNSRHRKCVFQSEENLTIFQHYSPRNCEVECLSKLLLKHCGCIPYNLPRLHGNDSICSLQSTCVDRMSVASKLWEYNVTNCDELCVFSCYDKVFYLDFFSAPLAQLGFLSTNQILNNISSDYVEENIAIIHLYFAEYFYRSIKQTEIFGGTDVLSSVGGLLGAFFGFGFISVVEFIFYMIIRPFRPERRIGTSSEKATTAEKPTIEVNPSWKRPIRTRFKRRIGLGNGNGNGNGLHVLKKQLYIEHILMSGEFLIQKTGTNNRPAIRRQFVV